MKVLVIDNGWYGTFAVALARSGLFERVGYFAPVHSDFGTAKEFLVGVGLSGVRREYTLFDVLPNYDAFVFPDLGWTDLQMMLRQRGMRVWGAGDNEILETDRIACIEKLKELGDDFLKPPRYRVAKGVSIALCIARNGEYIKLPAEVRGDLETTRHDASFPIWAHQLVRRLGPLAEYIPILITPPLDGPEWGIDMIVARGDIQARGLFGYEKKDEGYLGKVVWLPNLSKKVLPLLATLEDFLGFSVVESQFVSLEMRTGHLIDATIRVPQPPGDIFFLRSNIALIVHETLAGNSIPPLLMDAGHECVAQLVIKNNEDDMFGRISGPEDLDRAVSVHKGFYYKGAYWCPPGVVECASVVGSGSTPDEAIWDCLGWFSELKLSPNLSASEGVFAELQETVKEGETKLKVAL